MSVLYRLLVDGCDLQSVTFNREGQILSAKDEACSFCDSRADTQEHVIPEWLQAHFDLWNQRLLLWNGTSLLYRQALIPACKACNTGRLSRLEQRVQSGRASQDDLYLWALKIRYGLALRDSTLLLDRRNPNAGPLLSKNIARFGQRFILHAFRALENPKFKFRPSPFGSVFKFRQGAKTAGEFGLVDVPQPYWALAIVLPNDEILAVLFADRGVTKQIIARHSPFRRAFQNIAEHMPDIEPRALMFTLLRTQNKLVIPGGVRLLADGIRSDHIPTKIRLRPQHLESYRQIALYCGLPAEIADQAFIRDGEIVGPEFLRRR